MRPYLILCVVPFLAVAALAQHPVPYGPGYYGYGPYVPLISTPMLSLQTVSPNPVGATNATTGLIAGATNSTLSQIQGSTSSVYTVPVWYQGGAPLMTPDVRLWPERTEHERHFVREGHAQHGQGAREETRREWIYLSGSEHTASVAAASAGKGSRQAGHTYSNEDVTRQNSNNGMVKYNGKTEKM